MAEDIKTNDPTLVTVGDLAKANISLEPAPVVNKLDMKWLKQPSTWKGVMILAAVVIWIIYKDQAKDVVLSMLAIYGVISTFFQKS